MLFWERSRSSSSAYYGSGRVTLCQDSRATWRPVNGCPSLTSWVSIATLGTPLAYHACETVRIGSSGYEVHWLSLSDAFYLVDLYRRFRWTICLHLPSHNADESENGSLRNGATYLTACNLSHRWCNSLRALCNVRLNPYPTAFPYGNGMVLHFYQQQESSTTKTVHKVINRGLKTYVLSPHTDENFH